MYVKLKEKGNLSSDILIGRIWESNLQNYCFVKSFKEHLNIYLILYQFRLALSSFILRKNVTSFFVDVLLLLLLKALEFINIL